MVALVLAATALMIVLNLGLIAYTGSQRAWRNVHRRRLDAAVAALRPDLEAWLMHGEADDPPQPPACRTALDRQAVEMVLLPYATLLRGREKAQLIAYLRDCGVLQYRLDGLRHRRWWVRAQAAKTLGLVGFPEARTGLEALLLDRNLHVRQAALRALAHLGSSKSLPALVALQRRGDDGSRAYLTAALQALGPAVVPAQIGFLQPQAPLAARLVAIDVLAGMADDRAVEALARHLRPETEEVVSVALLKALRLNGGALPEGCELAGTTGLRHASDLVRRNAVRLLATWGSEAILDPLVTALHDPSRRVRRAAASTLYARGGAGLDALAAALTDPAAAAAVCDEVRQAGLIPPMLTALLSGDAAARAILLAAATGAGDVAAEALALPTLPAPVRQDLLAVRTTA